MTLISLTCNFICIPLQKYCVLAFNYYNFSSLSLLDERKHTWQHAFTISKVHSFIEFDQFIFLNIVSSISGNFSTTASFALEFFDTAIDLIHFKQT